MGFFKKKDSTPTIRYYMTTTNDSESESELQEDNTVESLRREAAKYKQLYEIEKAKNANLDSLYHELQELRDFKASSKNSEKSYHERVASLQGNHRAETELLYKQIEELKKRVPDDPSLPTYTQLREMYNKLVRAYNSLRNGSQSNEPEKEIVVHTTCNVEELNRLLSEAKDADKCYLFDNPDRVNRYIKALLDFLRMHALYDTDFLSCTNSDLRRYYAHKIMRKYEIEWHTKCRDKDIKMCMDETWKELHGYRYSSSRGLESLIK